jgi:hypothetical protein
VSELTDKRVKFIIAWYNIEKVRLIDAQRLLLLKRWIKTCLRSEEYEMANALMLEKVKQIRKMRTRRRTFFEIVKLKLNILIRNISK